jgi:hypothetical protein
MKPIKWRLLGRLSDRGRQIPNEDGPNLPPEMGTLFAN